MSTPTIAQRIRCAAGHEKGRVAPALKLILESPLTWGFLGNPHAVERAITKNSATMKKNAPMRGLELIRHRHGDFHREQAEQRGEFDHRVHRHGRGVLEGVADGVADDGRRVQVGAFLAEVHFHDLLGVVPRTTRVRHEDGLEEAEERDADEVANEERRIEERQRERETEHHDEDVPHALLRIHRAMRRLPCCPSPKPWWSPASCVP